MYTFYLEREEGASRNKSKTQSLFAQNFLMLSLHPNKSQEPLPEHTRAWIGTSYFSDLISCFSPSPTPCSPSLLLKHSKCVPASNFGICRSFFFEFFFKAATSLPCPHTSHLDCAQMLVSPGGFPSSSAVVADPHSFLVRVFLSPAIYHVLIYL